MPSVILFLFTDKINQPSIFFLSKNPNKLTLYCGSTYFQFGSIQSAENREKKCHRFWLRLRHAVILISNDRTSASKKISGMALIRTLTVSATAFERTKEKFGGFRQTVYILGLS